MQCSKCYGKGIIPQYGHVAGGICFQCNGRGSVDSRGKVQKRESVKTTQLRYVLSGLSKRETKFVLDCVLGGWSATITDKALANKLIALGYMVVKSNRYHPAPFFTPNSVEILINWDK